MLIVTAGFFITNMVLFPYRFDRFMKSYVEEFFVVFHQRGSSAEPGVKTTDK